MWFSSWSRLGLTVGAAVVAYAVLVVALRISGKRTLSKLNAFDLVVTVALGSVLATVVVSRQVAVAEGVVALCVLVLLQYTVAELAQRSHQIRRAVTASPTALVIGGRLQPDAMDAMRISEGEVAAAIRQNGFGSFGDVDVVVLESDGSLSVIADRGDGSALAQVEGAGGEHAGRDAGGQQLT